MLAVVVSLLAAWGVWYVLVLRRVAASNRRGTKAFAAVFEALGPQVVSLRGREQRSSEPLIEVSGALFRFGRLAFSRMKLQSYREAMVLGLFRQRLASDLS